MKRLGHQFVLLPPSARLLFLRVLDIVLFGFAGLVAFALRFDLDIPKSQYVNLAVALVLWPLVKSAFFYAAGVWRSRWSLFAFADALKLLATHVAASFVCAIFLAATRDGFPRSIYIIDMAVAFLVTGAVRALVRWRRESITGRAAAQKRKRTLIYGAGQAGIMVLRELRMNPALQYSVCGFVDDDSRKHGLNIHGVKVLGGGTSLREVARRQQAEMVLIAAPSAAGADMARILGHCADAQVAFKTVPGLVEMLQGRGLASQIRNVDVEDLLGRPPVSLDHGLISSTIQGKTILVTGAAGSIGSELCRQIARFGPERIVAVDMAETPLFFLEREMNEHFADVGIVPAIANLQDRRTLADLFAMYRPAGVFHAAAYKHVPMMEAHLFQALENNVIGTYTVATLAAEFGVDHFVMISSDKAVRPTSVMGMSKRLSELIVNSLQNGHTRFASVRFGNVLGSNGSVIPVFKSQIAAGGPVTVTHPEMRRYFMTIPEASQLVLQAGAMGKGGEIFVLDMGDPIKIVDLARNLILLTGLRPEEDLKIRFTGVRPGEKLYEELSTLEEECVPTHHQKIRIFSSNGNPIVDAVKLIEQLQCACSRRDYTFVLTLKAIIPDYNPSANVLERVVAHAGNGSAKSLPTSRGLQHAVAMGLNISGFGFDVGREDGGRPRIHEP